MIDQIVLRRLVRFCETLFLVVVFLLIIIDSINLSHLVTSKYLVAFVAVFGSLLAISVICYVYLKSPKVSAFVYPLLMFSVTTGLSIFMNGYPFLFAFYISSALFSLLYFQYKTSILYFIVTIILLVLFEYAFKIPLLGEQYSHYFLINLIVYGVVSILVISINIIYTLVSSINKKYKILLDAIMLSSPSYIILTDSDGRLEFFSSSVAEAFNIENPGYCKNRPVTDIFPSELMRNTIAEIIEDPNDVDTKCQVELYGQKRWLHFMSKKLPGEAACMIAFSDITDLMESKLNLEKALHSKSDFLANMSHEIRTPMNAILGMSELLLLSGLKESQKNYADNIKVASNSLLGIINDILDFSKIDAGKMSLTEVEFSLETFLDETISLVNMRTTKKSFEFFVDISKNVPKRIICDDLRLKQILINLLGNAVKFTEKGAIGLSVDCKYLEGTSAQLLFSVTDTGMGIKDEEIPKLFVEFERLDTRKNRNIVGTGLGLAISKRLIHLFGGNLTVESTYGKGSTFKFFIICNLPNGEATEKFSDIENRENLSFLVYEPQKYSSVSISKIFTELDLDFELQRRSETFFRSLLNQDRFSHIFLDSNVESNMIQMAKEKCDKLVLIKKSSELHEPGIEIDNIDVIYRPITIYDITRFLKVNVTSRTKRVHHETEQIFRAKDVLVLLVDDNQVNLSVASGLLSSFGISTVLANGGRESVELIRQHDFDLVFMDHMMPEVDGVDATRMIRSLGAKYSKIPIIGLSANAVRGVSDMLIMEGMTDFLSKPIQIPELKRVLLQYLPPEKIVK